METSRVGLGPEVAAIKLTVSVSFIHLAPREAERKRAPRLVG
jgi:hypothetical protein